MPSRDQSSSALPKSNDSSSGGKIRRSWIGKIIENPGEYGQPDFLRTSWLTILESPDLRSDSRSQCHIEYPLKVFFYIRVVHLDMSTVRLYDRQSSSAESRNNSLSARCCSPEG